MTGLLSSSAVVGIRAALPALGYANLASGRLLLAAVTIAAVSRRSPVARPLRAQLPLRAALGATGYARYRLLLSAVVSGGGARVQRGGAWPREAASHTAVVAVPAYLGEATTALGHSRRTTAPPTSPVLA